jgi:hypothetical protein
MVTSHVNNRAHRVGAGESKLERRRRHYLEARQALLVDLNRRQDELQGQLQQVQAEIAALSEDKAAPTAAPAFAAAAPGRGRRAGRPTLTDALVTVARDATGPMTARELAQELTRRKYPTKSGNLQSMVQNRLTELVKKGVFRRASGRRGVLLGTVSSQAKAPPTRGAAASKKGARASQKGWRKGQPPLRMLLTELLEKSDRPMGARELAEQVLATGYKTKSKDFADVVWTALGQLKGAENVKGEGWRLKKK